MIAAVGVDVSFFRPTPSPVLLASFSRRSVGLRSDLIGSLILYCFSARSLFLLLFFDTLSRCALSFILSCFSAGPALYAYFCIVPFCTACFAVSYVLAALALAWPGCAGGAARLG